MPLAAVRVKPRLPRAWLSFDSVDDYVEVAASPSLNPPSFTWEVWVKMHSNTYGIMDMGSIDSARKHIEFRGRFGYFEFRVANLAEDDYWSISSSPFVLNSWYHLVGTFEENGIMRFFVNGVSQGTCSVTSHMDVSAENLRLGRLQWGGAAFHLDGSIASARIYSRALAQEEIRHNMYRWGSPVKDGLVLWLAEDTINPPTWNDKSECGNDGTIYGAVKVERPRKAVRVNSAARVLAAVR